MVPSDVEALHIYSLLVHIQELIGATVSPALSQSGVERKPPRLSIMDYIKSRKLNVYKP
jgi:hypothetical protein